MSDVGLIAAVLIRHHTIGGPGCGCGHRYRIGDSISHHRALHVAAALELRRAGLTEEAALNSAAGAVALSGAEVDAG